MGNSMKRLTEDHLKMSVFPGFFVLLESFIVHYRSVSEICDTLRDLIPFLQFKKREKHPWRSVTFSKVAGF